MSSWEAVHRDFREYPSQASFVGFGPEGQQLAERQQMSDLVVVAFDQLHQAEEVRLKLQKLESEHLLDLAEVVVAVKEKAVKLSCTMPAT